MAEKTADEQPVEEQITELEKFDAERVDGVKTPANGFPILMMKALPETTTVEIEVQGSVISDADLTRSIQDAVSKVKAVRPESADDGWDWYDQAADLVDKALAEPDADRGELLKAVIGGEVDETPDIDGGKQAIALIAKLIGYEAQELEAGCLAETYDIQLLSQAVDCLKCWLGMEQANQDRVDAAKSAAEEPVEKAEKYNADEQKQMLAEGKAMRNPNGEPSYPIGDEEDLDNAIHAVGRGKASGNTIRRHVMRRAKAMNMSSKIPDTWQEDGSLARSSKSADTEDAGMDKEHIESLVSAAVTKATKGAEEELKALRAELAKVKATPIPGGPVTSIAVPPARAADDERAAKAAYYREMAKAMTNPADADGYRQLARQIEEPTTG